MSCENYAVAYYHVNPFAYIFLCGVLRVGERRIVLREYGATVGQRKYINLSALRTAKQFLEVYLRFNFISFK